MARVLMLLSNEYRPDVRVEKEAKALVADGNHVTVAAWDRLQRRQTLEDDAPRIRRVRAGVVRSMGGLFLNYPRFTLGLLIIARRERPEVVHAHDLDTLIPGMMISRLRRIPLVYDAHEHYAKMAEVDLPASLSPLIDRIEFSLVRKVDLLIVANRKIAEYLAPHHDRSIVEVMNCVDLPELKKGRRSEGPPILIYGGTLEPKRYVKEVVEAVKEVGHCMLKVAGRGRLASLVEDAASGNDDIMFLGYISHERLMDEMASADGILCLLDPSNENNVIGTPNRMFEAMAVGVPPIVTKGTLSGEMVTEERCGLAMDWSPESFHELIQELSDHETVERMGRNGREAAERRYNWGIMKRRLVDAYSLLEL